MNIKFQTIKRFAQKENLTVSRLEVRESISVMTVELAQAKVEFVTSAERYKGSIRVRVFNNAGQLIKRFFVRNQREAVEVLNNLVSVEQTNSVKKLTADLLAVEGIQVVSPIMTMAEMKGIANVLKASDWETISTVMNHFNTVKSIARSERNYDKYDRIMCIMSKINHTIQDMKFSGEVDEIKMVA